MMEGIHRCRFRLRHGSAAAGVHARTATHAPSVARANTILALMPLDPPGTKVRLISSARERPLQRAGALVPRLPPGSLIE